jgi:hypothetical protein
MMREHQACCETYLVKGSVMLQVNHELVSWIWIETLTLLDGCY